MRPAWLCFWLFLMSVTGAVAAIPDPPPPDDFPGAQYIDGGGCVFSRGEQGWVARTDREGAQICGFPPTLPPVRVMQEPALSMEAMLQQRLAVGLHVDDPAPGLPVVDGQAPLSRQSTLEQDLRTLIFEQDALRAAMMGFRDEELCALLGYRPAPPGMSVLGQDVTYGRCAGMFATVPGYVITEGVRQAEPEPEPEPDVTNRTGGGPAGGDVVIALPRRPVLTGSKEMPPAADPVTQTKPPAATHSAEAKRPVKQPVKSQNTGLVSAEEVEMIPAAARYIRIGTYPDQTSALSVARRLIASGHGAALTRHGVSTPQSRILLAGPYPNRAALIRALHELRLSGYASAVAFHAHAAEELEAKN